MLLSLRSALCQLAVEAKTFGLLQLSLLLFGFSLLPSQACHAEPPPSGTANLGTRYIPDDALVAIVATTKGLLDDPALQMFPVEVLRVQGKEMAGIDANDLVEARAAFSVNPQNMATQFGVVAKVDGPIDWPILLQALHIRQDPIQLDGFDAYPVDGPPGTVLTRMDDNTFYLGMQDYFAVMRDAKDGTGDLPQLVASMPAGKGVAVAVAMEQIRPMASGLAMQQSGQLAPELQPLARIPELTDAIKIHATLDGQLGGFKLSLVGTSEADAEQIQSILSDAMVAMRRLGIAEVSRNLGQSDQSAEMNDAIESYANRLADMFVNELSPTRDADHVTMAVQSQAGVATAGVLVGMLLPAVQAARTAARRMSSSNNMKQIMLGMHNHHSAFNELPMSAIVDDDGKPLLSWRVKLLPFVEQQALYQQFRLDEPWDSEHNLPLSKVIPAVYLSPGKNLGEGLTTYQAAVGEGMALEPLKKNKFRQFLDGLSNTIMLVETNDDKAVIWSKPEDIEIKMDRPLDGLGKARTGGFHVALSDGAVIFITESIEAGLFKSLLTRAGKEAIERPFNR